jgi:hypothetical protein
MSGDLIFFLDDMQDVRNYTFEDTSVSVYNMRTSEVSSPLPMVWKHQMIPASWLFPWN